MINFRNRAWFLLGALLLVSASRAAGQTVTGSIRGRVLNESGAPVNAANISARNEETGLRRTAISAADGSYMLAGLAPGSYEVSVQMIGYTAQPRTVRVLIGQALSMDLRLEPQAIQLAGVTVVGTRAVELRNSEIATNVTAEQIQSLPQQDRNFLNFAGLAPGVVVSREETNKNISAGGLSASKINVFVDGASYKNDILEGGVHGQDASRGNPFPQIAIQEFRVLTQNFKAEYQRAASAVVTATTKSGTNEFQLSGFVLGQNKGLVELDPGAVIVCDELKATNPEGKCAPKPEYERLQLGLSAGGPIVHDRLHYFAAFEGNYQNRQAIVTVGRPEFSNQFAQYEGTFDQPFRSSLAVAKLSYQPAPDQNLDLSWNGRFESDKRGFGGTTSFESAEDVRIGYNVLTLQHTLTRGNWLNQAHVSAQRSTWNPTAVNDEQDIGLNYEGVIRIGARSTEQRFVQDRLALRNDVTRAFGPHVVKAGANVDFLNYAVEKHFSGNPEFIFNPATSMTVPTRAFWGSGDPGMNEGNVQFGLFIQDDWDVTRRLQLNLGVRWDAETNGYNNKWVTPDSIRTRLASHVDDPDNRFTNGSEDRPMYLGAFQPRVGFSFDVRGDARTVVHGGFGIYYDREIWNHLLDERFRLQWAYRNFNFTSTNEAGKIPWRSEYQSRAGLQGLVNQVTAGVTNEVFLLQNDTRPPRSHQWNLGIRQMIGPVVAGAAYRGVRGYNLLSWYCGIPHPEHGYCDGGAPLGLPYSPVLSSDEGRTWYDAFDLTLEKAYTNESRWGVTVTYTMANGDRKGFDFFTIDFPGVNPKDWPVIPSNVEKQRLTASAVVGLPADIRLSSIVQVSSGIPYSSRDERIGWGPRRVRVDWFSQDPPNFRQVDVRVEKRLPSPGAGTIGVMLEAINVFNHDNFRGYEEFAYFGSANPNYRNPQPWTADPGRRLQLGLNFGF
jgi:carboxypeptidase family protein/TonB-dependent receptor-like protein